MSKIKISTTLPFLFGLILPIAVGISFYFFFGEDSLGILELVARKTASSLTFNIILVFFTIIAFIFTIMSFLENNSSLKESRQNLEFIHYKDSMKEYINNLQSNYLASQANITEDDKRFYLNKLIDKIESEGSEDLLKKLKTDISKEIYISNFEENISSTLSRLENERQSLSKRGSFNLTIGMTLSIIGLIIFGTVLLNSPQYNNINTLLINTIPKTFFIILIEFFSFFFLNLYKKSLDEIKYYQNEITNLESKYLALKVAKSMNNHKMISIILNELAKTERNFILEKDQTTIEIEKERISSNNTNNTLQAVKDIFKSKS